MKNVQRTVTPPIIAHDTLKNVSNPLIIIPMWNNAEFSKESMNDAQKNIGLLCNSNKPIVCYFACYSLK